MVSLGSQGKQWQTADHSPPTEQRTTWYTTPVQDLVKQPQHIILVHDSKSNTTSSRSLIWGWCEPRNDPTCDIQPSMQQEERASSFLYMTMRAKNRVWVKEIIYNWLTEVSVVFNLTILYLWKKDNDNLCQGQNICYAPIIRMQYPLPY
jgi:hypothetical protein